jgi:predicted glycosyltransferase
VGHPAAGTSVRNFMSAPPTILFQPLNHIGLGHINRLSAIAFALRQVDYSIRVPFVVEGSAHLLLDAFGLPYIPLPASYAMGCSSSWSAWNQDELSNFVRQLSQTILENLKPQIVVFDCLPNPTFASVAIERDVPIVLCLRQMRDLNRYLEEIQDFLPHIELILIPHLPNSFVLPESLQGKSRFVGQIVRPTNNALKSNLNPGRAHPLQITISGGGGGYPETVEFYNLAMKAVANLRDKYRELECRLILGPLFRDWLRLQPMGGITIVPFEPDIFRLFASAELVICQAGYNTVAELEQLGNKTILVPAERHWDDQFSRADRMAQMNPSFRVFRGENYIDLARIAMEFLQEPIPTLFKEQYDGAAVAARCLYEMIRTGRH